MARSPKRRGNTAESVIGRVLPVHGSHVEGRSRRLPSRPALVLVPLVLTWDGRRLLHAASPRTACRKCLRQPFESAKRFAGSVGGGQSHERTTMFFLRDMTHEQVHALDNDLDRRRSASLLLANQAAFDALALDVYPTLDVFHHRPGESHAAA